jgi:hypothetical protein
MPSRCKLFLADIKCLPEKDRHWPIFLVEAKEAGAHHHEEFLIQPEIA